MENAAEALKLAGFTLLFVTALSIAMTFIMQGKSASETIIYNSDKSNYYSNIETDEPKTQNGGNRVVSVNDIIPTLYRYSQENYIIIFKGLNSDIDFNGYIENGNEIERTR